MLLVKRLILCLFFIPLAVFAESIETDLLIVGGNESACGAERLQIKARITMDASDWGDVIRLSGAKYGAGPDLKSRFGESSAPEAFDDAGPQEMNPISWCMVLRRQAVKTQSFRDQRPAIRNHLLDAIRSLHGWTAI